MDSKPLTPDKVRLIAVTCPSCGISSSIASGYVARCPYCGAKLNNTTQ